jgi:hypothetical protein
VAVAEDERVDLGAAKLLDDPVGAPAHVRRDLAARGRVGPERPARPLSADICGRPPVVLAVVPLHQVVTQLGCTAEAGQLAGLASPAQRARQDEPEAAASKRLPDQPRLPLAFLVQRDVGSARVLPRDRPLRLAVTDEDDLHHFHVPIGPFLRNSFSP